MALDALPGTAGRDRHFLVVIAGGTAGGKCIAQPKAVFGRNGVGDVGESSRALVGRYHQVGVIAIQAPHLRRRNDPAGDDVVSQVEQAANETAVAFDYFLLLPQRRAARRQPAHHEAALGAHRHDQCVLDVLRFHQPENFGAEILGSLRPANAAAGDRPGAQMHTLDPRTVQEDLKCRTRLRQTGDPGGIEFQRQPRSRVTVRIAAKVIGAQGRQYHRQKGAQDAILVRADHRGDRAAQALLQQRRACARAARGMRRQAVLE